MKHKAIHIVGWTLIVFIATTSIYLLLYYSSLWLVGPDALFRLLGEKMYNSIYPVGGIMFPVILVLTAVWYLLPALISLGIAYWPSRLLAQRLSVSRRLVMGISALVIMFCGIFLYSAVFLDSPNEILASLFFKHDTEFGKNYSDKNFRIITNGMAKEKVLSLVGEPVRVYPGASGEVWWYATSPSSGSHWARTVSFDNNGIVIGRHNSFYVD